jgi:hypothetical protein
LTFDSAQLQCAPTAYENDATAAIFERRRSGDEDRVALCAHPQPGPRERSGLFVSGASTPMPSTALGGTDMHEIMKSKHLGSEQRLAAFALCEADSRAPRAEETF